MKKVLAFLLVLISIFTIASTSLISASAANATVAELSGVTLKNVKTKQYLNYDYGSLKNGTALRVWPWDGSDEQLFAIDNVKGDTYRILTNASSKYCVDVYRGNSKLKAGQLCDIWKAGDDTTAQNVVFYKCNDGSYIIRMAANTNLALAATSSKGRVTLVKFSTTDKSQRWIFQDKNGKNIDISSAGAAYKPAVTYNKTGICYTVDGNKYYEAVTTKAHNGVKKGADFWLNDKGFVVTDSAVLSKLNTFKYIAIQSELKSTTEGYIFSTNTFYEVFTNIKATEKLGDIVGKSSGILLNIGIGKSAVSLKTVAVQFANASVSIEDVKAVGFSSLVKLYCNNAAAKGNEALLLLSKPITDYDTLEKAYTLYAETCANAAAVDHLVGDDVRDMANSSTSKELLKYFENVISGFAESIFTNIDELKKALEGIEKLDDAKNLVKGLNIMLSMQELADSAGATIEYTKKYNTLMRVFPIEIKNTDIYERLTVPENKYVAYELYNEVKALMEKYEEGDTKTSKFTRANAWQCHGFACEALMDFWDTEKPTPKNTEYTYYKATSKNSYVSKIRPGDMVRYRNGNYDHTIVVTNVDDTYIYYADCNADGKCTFNYNQRMSKSTLSEMLTKKLIDTTVSTRGYICHYKNNNL